MKKIFTFWEPKDAMPAYIKLCIETWKKYLPDYEVVILDYSNYEDWIGKDCYDSSLRTNFSLPKQADAIRAAVLNKHGGIGWMPILSYFPVKQKIYLLQIRSLL